MMLVTSAILLLVRCGHAAEVLPDELKRSLERNANGLSGLEISGYFEDELLGDPAESLKQLAPRMSQAEFCQRCTFRLRLDGNRIHAQTKYPPSKFNSPNSINERSFDGAKLYSGTANPSEETRGMLVFHTPRTLTEDENRYRSWGTIFDFTYLHAAGFDGPQSSSELGLALHSRLIRLLSLGTLVACHNVRRNEKSLDVIELRYPEPWMSKSRSDIETDPNFQFVGESQELQRGIEKQRRTLVGEIRTVRFTLDPAMNHAVVRVEEYRGDTGQPMFVGVNTDFAEQQKGLWLPRTCTIDGYAIGLRPKFTSKTALYRTIIKIETIHRVEFSNKDFEVWFDVPGLNVVDYTHASAKPGRPYTYRVPVDVEQLHVSGRRYFWLGINAAVFIALSFLVLKRLIRKRRDAR